ncbi:TLC domain-containing protein 4-B-like isoform X3 [Thalassophryne amazonica]|uniref:TLC domain-containing protein 4-B-like isoform X3 n=1 Tax=Thalassophryne amazonica TaxID=390379 RepID=UPI00147207B3|nr:TLC domain-containing protein 4-B-like isoform X3 [Thalassophryne amazonica]
MEMRELTVVAGSFVGFQLLFLVASPLLSSAITPGYAQLPPTKLTEWNSRLVSTVHALIVGLFCLYILWFDDAVNANPVWGDPHLVKLNVAITCGYLLYDLLLLACNWSTVGDSFFVWHHLAALYAYGYVLTRGVLPYFANFRLISELSTPFVNQRWFFEALKYPRSNRMVVLNGVAMAVVFFLVRIAIMPSYWVSVFATFGTPEFERLGFGAQVAWITSCVALDILNTIWMYKITRGCYKVLTVTKVHQVKEGAEAPSSTNKKKHINNHSD